MVVSLGPGKFYGSSLPRPRLYTDVKFSDERVDPPAPFLDPLLAWASDAHWSMGGLSFTRLRHQGRIEGNVKKLVAEREGIARKKKRSAKFSRSTDEKASEGKIGKRRKYVAVSEEEDTDEDEADLVVEEESELELESSEEVVVEMKKKKRSAKLSRSPDEKASEGKTGNSKRAASLTPPPAPIAVKRRKYMAVSEEDDTEEDEADLVDEEESELESESSEEVVVEMKKRKMPVRKLYDEFNKVARESKRIVESGAAVKVVRDLNKEKEKIGEKSVSNGGIRASPRLGKVADVGSVAPVKTRASRRLVKRG